MHESGQLGGGRGLSRRRFLAAAGGGVAALALGNLKPPTAQAAPLPLVRGFNDDWNSVLTSWGIQFGNWAGGPAGSGSLRYVRQVIDWAQVQPTNGGPFDFTHYWALRENLREWNTAHPDRPLRILPVCMGCPGWAEPWGYQCPNYWNWCYEGHDAQFGRFVAETLKYFDGVVDAAEIWNEPNTPEFGAVPYSRFASLVWNGQYYTGLYQQQGNYSTQMTVLSGGLAMRPPAPRTSTCYPGNNPSGESGSMNGWSYDVNQGFVRIPIRWQDYLQGFQNSIQWSTFDIGIHPYSFTAPSQTTTSQILAFFDEAKNLTVQAPGVPLRNLWVTETGCPSRAPWGAQGQKDVLLAVTAGLSQRSRCKAIIVHQMWDSGDPNYPSVPPSSPWSKFGLCNSITPDSRKIAYGALQAAWV